MSSSASCRQAFAWVPPFGIFCVPLVCSPPTPKTNVIVTCSSCIPWKMQRTVRATIGNAVTLCLRHTSQAYRARKGLTRFDCLFRANASVQATCTLCSEATLHWLSNNQGQSRVQNCNPSTAQLPFSPVCLIARQSSMSPFCAQAISPRTSAPSLPSWRHRVSTSPPPRPSRPSRARRARPS